MSKDKLTLQDLLDKMDKKHNNTNYNSSDITNISKNQQHFGHRKRIKPWRTGTKSQQQIVPKGFNKGFRG